MSERTDDRFIIRRISDNFFFCESVNPHWQWSNWLQNARLFKDNASMRQVVDEIEQDVEIVKVRFDNLRIVRKPD